MSRLQGWDPCKIEGEDFPNAEYKEDRYEKGDVVESAGLGLAKDPQGPCPYPEPLKITEGYEDGPSKAGNPFVGFSIDGE
jgi:hypothetical protein